MASGVIGPPQGRWGLPDLAWTMLFFIGGTALGVVLMIVMVVVNPEVAVGGDLNYGLPEAAWMITIAQGLGMAGLVGWPLIVARWKGEGWRHSYGFLVNGRAWLVGGIGGIITFITLIVLTAVMVQILGEPIDSAAADVVEKISNTPVAYGIFLLFIAFGAPFVEEITFRGLLWGTIVKRGWSPWIATAVSGLVFGLFHFEPLRIIPLVAAGFLLGVIRHYAGLGASMFAHAIVNTIGVAAILLAS